MAMNQHSPIKAEPQPDSKTGRVWAIADRISKESGARATRKQVIEASMAEGINRNTAATQYSLWKHHQVSRIGGDAAEGAPKSQRATLSMGKDGRVLIPAPLRSLMMIGENGKLSAIVEDGELKIMSPLIAVRRLQRLVKENDTGTGSPVDELLAERRAEAREE
jgi:bifunctional DNA-binding transcriptional regulator/antitoxin component of YhaV-PrlF toxin-antitoxin module